MAAVFGDPRFLVRETSTGVTWETLLHGEQGIGSIPLTIAATVVAQTRVTDILDKGEGRGALIYTSDISGIGYR
ncbi:MAG: hypothetical protein CM1200mP41_26730 [Gammaproteobacteria bacterium]|nr:MAG: hypothetical protein CM1200mP41_26730 [Gammaproteobacteria bacterium]